MIVPSIVDDPRKSVVLITGSTNKFGTGFSIWREPGVTWILTCAHVVDDAGGNDQIRADAKPAEVVGRGEPKVVDLAVLRVPGLEIPPFKLGLAGGKDMPCGIPGCTAFMGGLRKRESLEAVLDRQVEFSECGERWITAWALRIVGTTPLDGGYSGSPVMSGETETVFAVASHKEGERGYAISLTHLPEIWPEMPPDLLGAPPPASRALPWEQRELLENQFRLLSITREELREWCHQAMPPDAPHEIPVAASRLDLLEWLSDKGQLAGGQVPLLTVLAKVLRRTGAPDARSRLEQCIQRIADRFGVVALSEPESVHVKTESPPVLMLEIWPTAPGKRCNVQGWLSHPAERVHNVFPVREGENALHLENDEDLTRLVEDLRTLLVERGVNDQELVVEFILPNEMLSQAVEQWTDLCGEPLGICWPVVVRSRERLRELGFQLGWEAGWKTVWMGEPKRFQKGFWWMEDHEESWRRQARGKVENGACVALGFVPDLRALPRHNAVTHLLRVGASIVFWPRRDEELARFRPELDSFLADHCLGHLPKTIRDMRRRLWEQQRESSPCYHLALLWDDPTRRPYLSSRSDDEFYRAP